MAGYDGRINQTDISNNSKDFNFTWLGNNVMN